ncbi:MAG: copper-binding protein [Isosphaeraceae bacterium]|nr:copper-binding protein [Isosphaeraceae bacterium]
MIRLARLVALIVLASCAGCGTRSSAPPGRGRGQVREYKLVGVVRKVDRDHGTVSIRHEAIPGYMPAMTMPFPLQDRELLEDLRPGDEVQGTLRVSDEQSELIGLEITRLATTPEAEGSSPPSRLLQAGQEVPDFAMTTQDGETLHLSDLRGKVVVLTFIYTRCPLPEFCPRMDQKFAALAAMLKARPGLADRVRLLSVSFDPEHDTPEVLARHARVRGATPPLWTFAVASHEELWKVAEPLGLAYGPRGDEIVHNLSTALIDTEGRLIRLATGAEGRAWSPADFFQTIYSQIHPLRQ